MLTKTSIPSNIGPSNRIEGHTKWCQLLSLRTTTDRNGHYDALALLLCHPEIIAPSPSHCHDITPGTVEPSPQTSAAPPSPSHETTRIDKASNRSFFGRKPWRNKIVEPEPTKSVSDGISRTPRRIGRGRRPVLDKNVTNNHGATASGSFKLAATQIGALDGIGMEPEDAWVLYHDANGFPYYWNEAVQESRYEMCSLQGRLLNNLRTDVMIYIVTRGRENEPSSNVARWPKGY